MAAWQRGSVDWEGAGLGQQSTGYSRWYCPLPTWTGGPQVRRRRCRATQASDDCRPKRCDLVLRYDTRRGDAMRWEGACSHAPRCHPPGTRRAHGARHGPRGPVAIVIDVIQGSGGATLDIRCLVAAGRMPASRVVSSHFEAVMRNWVRLRPAMRDRVSRGDGGRGRRGAILGRGASRWPREDPDPDREARPLCESSCVVTGIIPSRSLLASFPTFSIVRATVLCPAEKREGPAR